MTHLDELTAKELKALGHSLRMVPASTVIGPGLTFLVQSDEFKSLWNKVASPKQWQAIIAAKGERCRLVHDEGFGRTPYHPVQYHHLVPRDLGGDDVADNIVPLCQTDHELVTQAHKTALYRLGEALTDAERAYVVGKLGEDGPARLFGVGRG